MKKYALIAVSLSLLGLAIPAALQALLAGERLSMIALALLGNAALADVLLVMVLVQDRDEEKAEAQVPSAPPAARISRDCGLSLREQEVLEKYLEVRDIRQCATDLYIAPGTVKAHLSHIYVKTGVSGRDELLRLCEAA